MEQRVKTVMHHVRTLKDLKGITSGNNRCLKDTVKLWLFVKPVMLKFMFVKMRKTNGEPYTGRLVRTVGGRLGNLPSQDDKAPSAEPTIYNYLGCTKPFVRLWISSLTDRATVRGWITCSRESVTITSTFLPNPAAKPTG